MNLVIFFLVPFGLGAILGFFEKSIFRKSKKNSSWVSNFIRPRGTLFSFLNNKVQKRQDSKLQWFDSFVWPTLIFAFIWGLLTPSILTIFGSLTLGLGGYFLGRVLGTWATY